MDVKDAIQLIEGGRLNELDTEVLWQIQDVLSSSNEPDAMHYLAILQGPVAGPNMAQKSLEMQNIINNNMLAIQNIERNFNPFVLDINHRPVNKALLPIFNLYKRIQVDNKALAEEVKSEDLFAQNVEISRISGMKEVLLDKKFATLSAEEQNKAYIKAVVMAMEENAFVLVSNQTVENQANQKHNRFSAQEKAKIANEVEKRFSAMINPANADTFKLSNVNIIGTTVAEVNRLSNTSNQILKYTGSKDLIEEVAVLDNKFSKIYPDAFMVLRPLAQTPNLGMIAGGIGMSSLVATNIAQAVHDSNPAKKEHTSSMFSFFKEQPKAFKSFKDSIVGSLKKVYSSVTTLMDLGYLNTKMSLSWKKMVNYLSKNGLGDSDPTIKGITPKAMMKDLSIMSVDATQALKMADNDKRVVAWKDFHNKFVSSRLGQALNADRCMLVSENPKDYTNVVKIVLNKDIPGKKADVAHKKKSSVFTRMIKSPAAAARFITRGAR